MNDKNYVYRCEAYYTGNYRYVNPPERSDAVCLSYCVTQSNCLGTSFSSMDGICIIYTGPGEVISGGTDDLLIEISADELPDTICAADSPTPATTSQSTTSQFTTTTTSTTTTTTTQAPIPTCDNLISDPGFELVPTTQYATSNFATDNWSFSGTQTTVKPYSGTNGDATGFIGFYSGMWYGEAAAVFRPTSHPATGKISQTVRPQPAQAYQLSYNVLPYMVYNDIQSCTITSKYNGITLDTFVLPKYGGAWEQRSATFIPLEPSVEVSFEVACDHYDGESCGEDPADNCGAFIALDEVILQLRDPSVCTMQETPLKTYPY
ncbi:hypothetical protein PMZ80_001299 [Knufia obscura]|uniref:Apple domain-containing protein n=1 Tax=Knufia obscura TaxID=1635080 RepID=A0ABR0S391_9EURO|nr:hypothetical protein PMZ80_001299 [Knufia obscura]